MEKLNVGIADDNELIVSLLSDIVAQDEELRVVGTARNGEEAYQMIKNKTAGCGIIGYHYARNGRACCYGQDQKR